MAGIGQKGDKNIFVSNAICTQLGLEYSQKNSNKLKKKLKNVILASFLAKSGRHGLKIDKKNFDSSTVSTQLGKEHSQKNRKQIEKFLKSHSSFISGQISLGQAKKKIKFFFVSKIVFSF